MKFLTHLFFETQCSPLWWDFHICKITGLSNFSVALLAGLAFAGYKWFKSRKSTATNN